jgi:hypothetical protein
MKYIYLFFIAFLILCNSIESGAILSTSDISDIEKLYNFENE